MMEEQIRAYADLRHQLADAEAYIARLKADIDEIERSIVEAMQAREVESIRIAGLGTGYLVAQRWPSVLASDRERQCAWLRENDNGDLIKETVHPMAFASLIREMDSDPDRAPLIPEWVKIARATGFRLRK